MAASPPQAGETGQQPHIQASRVWELTDTQAATRHGQKCCNASSHSHQKAQKRYNLGYAAAQADESKRQQQAKTGPCRTQHGQRVTLGQSKSVTSKGASTGLQKRWEHSLHPEKECAWKTAEERNENVL